VSRKNDRRTIENVKKEKGREEREREREREREGEKRR